MRLHFSASEAQYEPHSKPLHGPCPICGHYGDDCTQEPPLDILKPAALTIDVPGSWVQLTYDHLRIAEDGDPIAWLNGDGFWEIDGDHKVTMASMLDGTEATVTSTNRLLFTDIVVEA